MSEEPENIGERITRCTLGNTLDLTTHGFQRLAIQLFGFLGHGKSSLVNSCVCVTKDEEYQNVAGAGMTEGGLTKTRWEYKLTNTLVMIDNRGFSKMKPQEIIEACAQIRSLRDIGEVSWDKDNLKETLKQFPLKYQNRPADFILPVLVYSANRDWSSSEGKDIQEFITHAFRITDFWISSVCVGPGTMQDPTTDRDILEKLRTYIPGDSCERVCLQLCGMPGHGKSSLINTCVCVVQDGDLKNVAGAGKSNQPITMERKDFHLADKIVITDNRGVNKMSKEELVEITAQFCHLRGRDRVEWNQSFRENLNAVLAFMYQKKEVIVPIFVYSAENLVTPERYTELEPFIRDAHRITGIYPIIVLTKVQNDGTELAILHRKFKELGAKHIFLIENYTMETCERNPETKSRILMLLDTCLQEADRQISENRMKDLQQEYLKNAMYVIESKMMVELENKVTQIERVGVQLEAAYQRMQEELDQKIREIEELREQNQAREREMMKVTQVVNVEVQHEASYQRMQEELDQKIRENEELRKQIQAKGSEIKLKEPRKCLCCSLM
ncbi:uncharacterized protein [Aquarana catesbeiana]|uniref:uncharacterized protein n=1 Tax=Aquarana catesbeiana TaxID=8400 RepID=UPI003CC981B0